MRWQIYYKVHRKLKEGVVMISREGDFLPSEVALLRSVSTVFARVPNEFLGCDKNSKNIPISCCHILARAFAQVFHLKYEDGFFYPNFLHSWLVLESGNILDLFPVGSVSSPILILKKFSGPGKYLYISSPNEVRTIIDEVFGEKEFERALKEAIAIIGRCVLDG